MTKSLEHSDPIAEMRRPIEAAFKAGDYGCARQLAEKALERSPKDSWTWNVLGLSLRATGLPAAAISAYARSLELKPNQAGVLSNCGNAFRDLQRFEEAIALHRRAMQGDPKSGQYVANLGVALRDAGLADEALAAFDHAIALDPKSVPAHFDRAQLRLALGDYRKGWPEFEWRWRMNEMRTRKHRQPLWDGAARPNDTLLIWPEQGFGDTILSVRFARLAKKRVGHVILACQPELARLFQNVEGIDRIVRYGERKPAIDVHCPLMTLPRFFVPNPNAVPAPPRLNIPASAREKLAPALVGAGNRLKVGIVWSGSVTFKSNHLRATTIERFLPLAALPGVQLFSLQKGPRAAELSAAGAGAVVIDLAPLLEDFADTAAAVAGLDLVIMADSAVAHLAGSLGKTVWNLIPFVPYWLYMRHRSDTPWYPSMRLFRQKRLGDWDGVFAEVVIALRALLHERHGPLRYRAERQRLAKAAH